MTSSPTFEEHTVSTFVRNAWYAVAWSDQVTTEPSRVWVLDEPVALFRTASGLAVALDDRCPHRRFPLSLGRVDGEHIRCGYHGFCFDRSGTCVEIPSQGEIPATAKTRAYPVVERDRWLWLWPGRPELADPDTIPDHHWTAAEGWATFGGRGTVDARYSIAVDNGLDLSHETFLHPSTVGNRAVASTPLQVRHEGKTIYASRHIKGVQLPPLYAEVVGFSGAADRWQDQEFHVPNFSLLHVRLIAPHGGLEANMKVMYSVVPATQTSTSTVWAVSRDFAVDQPEIGELMRAGVEELQEEDARALEAQEEMIALDGDDRFTCSTRADAAALLARRIHRRLVQEEAAVGVEAAAVVAR
jgi:vanillate O-demethylase monooxygenase subunit